MGKSFLRKYYEDNNPVSERLTINKKIFIRSMIMCACALAFVILRLINNHGIFEDFSPLLKIALYVVMLLCFIVASISLFFLLLSQISKEKYDKMFNRISFEKKRIIFTILDFAMIIPICICVSVLIYGHIFRIHPVSGPSMEPSFYGGERVVTTYNINDIKRGDVIIVRIDKETYNEDETFFIIKRVVGLPGDKIEWNNGILYINGDDKYEDYISTTTGKNFTRDFFYFENRKEISCGNVIPDGYVFVLGDNRGDSKDSRDFGLIPVSKIKGIVVLKFDGLKPTVVKRGVLE